MQVRELVTTNVDIRNDIYDALRHWKLLISGNNRQAPPTNSLDQISLPQCASFRMFSSAKDPVCILHFFHATFMSDNCQRPVQSR
jgi:hypothetical protein